ncbi:MAG: HIT family protein [Patescibacteria group bacterium]
MQRTIFHEIVDGNIPCHNVYEDEQYLAFLDIYPRSKGHTLVIPKQFARWTYDVPDFGGYWETVRRVMSKIDKALSPVWFNFATFGEIPYAHIHILPRYTPEPKNGDAVFPKEVLSFSDEEFANLAKEILSAN